MKDWKLAIEHLSLPPHVGQWYLHVKGGLYVVVNRSIEEDSMEQLVTYSTKHGHEPCITRTVANFTEIIIHNGMEVRRFQLCDMFGRVV